MSGRSPQSALQRVTSGFVRSVAFPIWAKYDHPAYFRYIDEFEKTQFWTPERIEQLQLQKLKSLLEHAFASCPYYRSRMLQSSLRPEDCRSLADLGRLPLLTKRDIQQNGEDMTSTQVPADQRVRNQTGGSTGSPLQFWVDKERLDSRLASTVRHNRWAGYEPGDWCAELWGARLDRVIAPGLRDWLRNQLVYRVHELNTSVIREQDWQVFIAKLRQDNPRTLVTYAHSAVLFGQYLRENNIPGISFDSIITTAEVLLPEQRTFLEETFQAKVFNRYGCREMSVIASECDQHTGLHVNSEALLVEIVPDERYPAPYGKVVITDLLNRSMPLIRYEIGDVAAWATGDKCSCGRGLPRLLDLQGRTTDFLVLGDGRTISGPALTLVVADMPEVRQVQFVQKSLDWVVLRVVPGRSYGPEVAAELRKRFALYLDEKTRLDLVEVDSIASELSGKYRFVINETSASPVSS